MSIRIINLQIILKLVYQMELRNHWKVQAHHKKVQVLRIQILHHLLRAL